MGRVCFLCIAFGLVLVALRCTSDSPSTPTPSEPRRYLDTVTVADGSIGQVGGRGFYFKTMYWYTDYQPSGGDSVLRVLLNAHLAVEGFWHPLGASICLDPFQHEREIVKLIEPDRAIVRLGFMPLASGYSDGCLRHWRHYRLVWTP